MNWFHLHRFDPEKWKEISRKPVSEYHICRGVRVGEPTPIGNERVFSNTCTKCGDLVFRRVMEISND